MFIDFKLHFVYSKFSTIIDGIHVVQVWQKNTCTCKFLALKLIFTPSQMTRILNYLMTFNRLIIC